ncbi:MAG: hypothetical protein AB9866_18420 [Syntrophobacteraceae bacterium]
MRVPPALLPYQQKWIADNAPVKVCEKSRRVGISWCEAANDALTAGCTSGMDVWYLGYNREMAAEFINDTAFWVKHFGIAACEAEETLLGDEGKDILAYRIRFASGHRVTALSSRPSNLRGKQGKVVIDEAAFHKDLPQLIKAAVALLMWGGRLALISTHNGDENPFNELVNDIRSNKTPYSLHRITLDDALEEGLYRRICLKAGMAWSQEAEEAWRRELLDFYGEFADEELFCLPSRGSGAWLPRALIETCMDSSIPVLRWSCKPDFAEAQETVRRSAAGDWLKSILEPHLGGLKEDKASFFGEDFGRSGDLTVSFPLQENGAQRFRAPFVIELRNVPFRQQEQILFHIADRLPRFSGGALDARGNGHYLAEVAMQRYGSWRIRGVMLSDKWYLENMPACRAAFEDRSITIPKDPDILDDLRSVRIEKGIARVPESCRGKGRDGGQRHGDAAIACALAWYAARQIEGGPVEYEPAAERRLSGFRGY